jgi:FkbM family methyltransferase
MINGAVKAFANKVQEKGFFPALCYTAKFFFDIPYRKLWLEPAKHSYSQAGEDLWLERAIGNKTNGFYIDIGAYDPHHLSNTKHFYKKGWSGINVEPNKLCHANFVRERPRDLNLNVGIDMNRGNLTFYVMDSAPLSTFSKEKAEENEKLGYKIISKDSVEVITLTDLFEKHVGDKLVDFVSIDAEGLDVSVMEGNDWNRWRPKAICIEVADIGDRSTIPAKIKEITDFMNRIRYQHFTTVYLYGTPLNMIFVAQEVSSAK